MSQLLKWIFFLLCVNQNDERSVLPMSSGDASAFLRERMGSWLCFSPSAVISLKRRAEWRELWVIDSAFILQVFGGFEVIESLGMGDSSEMSMWCPSGVRRPRRCVFACAHLQACMCPASQAVRQRAQAPCSQIHVILVANHFCSHMTSLPDWFHSAVEGGKIKQMLSEIAAVQGGGRGGSRVGGCLLERWSEGWKWRERESVMQSALCHVVTWYSGGRCYSINQQSFQQLFLFTARWLFCRGGSGARFLHDASEYPCKD